MLLYCWCSSIPFKHFNTVNDISQDDFIAFCRVVTATSNYFFPVWIVPLEDKVSVLLSYLEEKHLNKPFSTLQEGAALLSEFRIQLLRWGSSVVYSQEQPNFKCICVRKLES